MNSLQTLRACLGPQSRAGLCPSSLPKSEKLAGPGLAPPWLHLNFGGELGPKPARDRGPEQALSGFDSFTCFWYRGTHLFSQDAEITLRR
jgi:hypothetical protein